MLKNGLFRVAETKQITGEEISQEFCPISGRYTFTYNLHEGAEDKAECPDPMSELDNCPRGSELNLKFRRCSFENHGEYLILPHNC